MDILERAHLAVYADTYFVELLHLSFKSFPRVKLRDVGLPHLEELLLLLSHSLLFFVLLFDLTPLSHARAFLLNLIDLSLVQPL